jgi:hypothetical protein|uniref:Uncharacterized protein n=1 Tax=Caldisericum exile TaxID=693075 RepID=A0A7C4TY09_9BACT
MRRKLTKREETLNTIALLISTFTLLFFYIIPGWPFRHIGAYGGSMPFSSIPTEVVQEVKNSSVKHINSDDIIFIIYYQDDSNYHLVGFKLSDGTEKWFAEEEVETKDSALIAANIETALESGLHAYVKEGYAVRIPKLKSDRYSLFVIFKLYHILPETTFNWFRRVHKAEIEKYVFDWTSEHYIVTHYKGVYPEFP